MTIKRLLIDGDIPLMRCAKASQKRMALVSNTSDLQVIDDGPWGEKKKEHKEALAAGEVIMEEYFQIGELEKAIHSLKKMTTDWVSAFGVIEGYSVHLGHPGGLIRSEIYPLYKNGRGIKPVHYAEMRKYYEQTWAAAYDEGLEADDAVGWRQFQSLLETGFDKDDAETCIQTIDKDLNCIAGWHHNPYKDELTWITPDDADFCFCTQWLMGDTTDSIPGLFGVGAAAAEKALKDAVCWGELVQAVFNAYVEHAAARYGIKPIAIKKYDEVIKEMLLTGELIWIRRDQHTSFTMMIEKDLASRRYTGVPKATKARKKASTEREKSKDVDEAPVGDGDTKNEPAKELPIVGSIFPDEHGTDTAV